MALEQLLHRAESMSRTKTVTLSLLAVLVGAIVAIRLAAPHYLLQYANRTLDGLDGYSGHIGDLDLNIWRGAYTIEDVEITKETAAGATPFVKLDQIDISLHWDALLDGALVGEIELISPTINYVAEKKKESPEEQAREAREAELAKTGDSSWQKQVKELVPVDINRLEIRDGEIHYRDPRSEPPVDLYVQGLNGRINNLTNSEDLSEDLVATAMFKGSAMNGANLELDGRIDPYAKLPTFDLAVKLERLQLKQLNDFFRAYANVDVERGHISVYTEVKSEKGRFKGYVKPLVKDLRILRWKDEEGGTLNKLWQGLVEAGTELFENDDKEQVATKIPFSGRIENPNADLGTTVLYVLKNAFIRAIDSGLEGSVGEGALSARGEQQNE